MRLIFSKFVIVFAALFAISCGGYSKLVKSPDNTLKYKKAIEYYNAGKYSRSITLLYDVAKVFEGTLAEDSVAFYLGASLYKSGDFYNSSEILDLFRKSYQYSPFLEEAEYMYAKGHYFMSPEVERDQTTTKQAMVAIQEYLERYPNSVKKEPLKENLAELQQKLYDKSFMSAKLYYNIGYYNSAIFALRNALEQFPETNHREEILYYIISAAYHFANNSIETLQRVRYLNLQDAYYSFISEFPDSRYRKEADKMQETATNYLAKYTNSDTENGNKKE